MKHLSLVSMTLLFVAISCTPAPTPAPTRSPTPTVTPTNTPEPAPTVTATVTPTPTETPIPPVVMIDACGVNDTSGRVFSIGQRGTIHLASGEQRNYCISDAGAEESLRFETTILGSIPQPEALVDDAGGKLEYLGVRDHAFVWQKADGGSLVLPAFYPRGLLTKPPTWTRPRTWPSYVDELAAVLVWDGKSDQRRISGWHLEVVRLRDRKPILYVSEPFIALDKSQLVRLALGTLPPIDKYGLRQGPDPIPPHYELVSLDADGKSIPHTEAPVGVSLYLPTAFHPSTSLLWLADTELAETNRGYVNINSQPLPLMTFSIYGQQASFLDEVPVEPFVDANGQPLSTTGIQGYTFTWRDRNGELVVLPALYPGLLNGAPVAPVFLCDGCSNPQVLTQWKVWLVNIKTGQTVKTIDNPFLKLNKTQVIALNDDTGYLEVVDTAGPSSAQKGQRIGAQLFQPPPPPAMVYGMPIYRFPKEDAARIQNLLDWMKQVVPNWFQFILNQRPVDLILDPGLETRGYAGSGGCCYETEIRKDTRKQIGHITVVNRPPSSASDDLWFLVTLVHEATHVRDQRANKFQGLGLDDRASCRATERSAMESQRAFLADLVNAQVDDKTRFVAQSYLKGTEDILARDTFDWAPACR